MARARAIAKDRGTSEAVEFAKLYEDPRNVALRKRAKAASRQLVDGR